MHFFFLSLSLAAKIEIKRHWKFASWTWIAYDVGKFTPRIRSTIGEHPKFACALWGASTRKCGWKGKSQSTAWYQSSRVNCCCWKVRLENWFIFMRKLYVLMSCERLVFTFGFLLKISKSIVSGTTTVYSRCACVDCRKQLTNTIWITFTHIFNRFVLRRDTRDLNFQCACVS